MEEDVRRFEVVVYPLFVVGVFVHFLQGCKDVEADFECEFIFAEEVVGFDLEVKAFFVAELELEAVYSECSRRYGVIVDEIKVGLDFWDALAETEFFSDHDFSFNVSLIILLFSFVLHWYEIDF